MAANAPKNRNAASGKKPAEEPKGPENNGKLPENELPENTSKSEEAEEEKTEEKNVLVFNRTNQKQVLTLPNNRSITLMPYEEKSYNIGSDKVENVFGYWIGKNIVNIKTSE